MLIVIVSLDSSVPDIAKKRFKNIVTPTMINAEGVKKKVTKPFLNVKYPISGGYVEGLRILNTRFDPPLAPPYYPR